MEKVAIATPLSEDKQQEQEAYPRAHPNRSGIPGSMIKGWIAKCTEKVTIATPQPEGRQQS